MNKLGKFIKTKREELGIQQKTFAEKLGFTKQAMFRIESGEMPLPKGKIKNTAKILGLKDQLILELYMKDQLETLLKKNKIKGDLTATII